MVRGAVRGTDGRVPNGRTWCQSDTLSDQQSAAVSAFVDGQTPADVAQSVGVELADVETWLADPAFVASANQRRADNVSAHMDRLRAMVPAALDALRDVLTNGEPRDRIAAARVVLAACRLSELPDPPAATTPADVETDWRKAAEHRLLFGAF